LPSVVGDVALLDAVVLTVYMCFFVFFFFQAEDGIRDLTVTGVQTCALPISPSSILLDVPLELSHPLVHVRDLLQEGLGLAAPVRSEERRVGKECRSRWSAYQ